MNVKIKNLKKFEDERGLLVEILRDDEISEKIKHIYFSISKPSVKRGNHYHKRKVEWFCVAKGKARLILEDNKTKERKELILSIENPKTVEISPNITHIIENIGNDEMYLIVIVNEVFDPKDTDTYMV